ncbi:MAG: cupin domain-containing protein [Dongiaceae bacterium]
MLIGGLGERVKFHVRYFELDARGYTSLESHHHSHVVIGVRGRGRVTVAGDEHLLGPMDAIYIGPNIAHQLRATGAGKFGFFCIVDAKRDRPRRVRRHQPSRSAASANHRR